MKKTIATQLKNISQYPSRILMLVPHEPTLDPRIKWVTQLCARIGRTDIIGFCWTTGKPLKEYEGIIYTERIISVGYSMLIYFLEFFQLLFIPRRYIHSYEKKMKQSNFFLLSPYPSGNFLIDLIKKGEKLIRPDITEAKVDFPAALEKLGQSETIEVSHKIKIRITFGKFHAKTFAPLVHIWSGIRRTLTAMYTQDVIARTLYLHAKSVCIPPKLIICHDIYALQAAIKLKDLFGTPVIYDSHELWSEADYQASKLQKTIAISIERKLIRQADVVITVTPQIARYLEQLYGIKNVIAVPNAEPLHPNVEIEVRKSTFPIRFLLQGQASSGRGIEEILESWNTLNDDRAVLILRCPENRYFTHLQKQFWEMISNGQVIIAPAVDESELIEAASQADVGIIPYGGPNLNHVYACPNKLSQYMQAGLAIFHNSDQEFVSEIIIRHKCGLSYDLKDPSGLVSAVKYLINHPEELENMQRNSIHTAQNEFNWEFQSLGYLNAIDTFFKGKQNDNPPAYPRPLL